MCDDSFVSFTHTTWLTWRLLLVTGAKSGLD
jgi:hypothetical protein